MKKKRLAADAKVAPEFELKSPEGVERQTTMGSAWIRAKELSLPVDVKFLGWRRVDSS